MIINLIEYPSMDLRKLNIRFYYNLEDKICKLVELL